MAHSSSGVANRLWEKFIGACYFGDGQKFSMKKDSRRKEERRKWRRRRWWLREIKKLDQRLLTTENNKSRIKHERARALLRGKERARANERDDAKSNWRNNSFYPPSPEQSISNSVSPSEPWCVWSVLSLWINFALKTRAQRIFSDVFLMWWKFMFAACDYPPNYVCRLKFLMRFWMLPGRS